MRQILEQTGETGRESLQSEMALECSSRARAEMGDEGLIGDTALDRPGQSLGIFRRHQQAVHFVPNPFRNAADIRADDDFAEAHRFQDCDWHRFVTGRADQTVGRPQQFERLRMINFAGEHDAA